METKQRKIEVHRLTISGLPEGKGYGKFIKKLRGASRPVAEMVMKAGEKSHALNEATLRNSRLRLRFLSFTKGHRPDVLDTDEFSLIPNPLAPSQTNVEWTHVLGGKRGGRYILLVEKHLGGIYPSTVGRYLQWAIDSFYEPPEEEEDNGDSEPITVNLEAEPGPQFLTRMESLDRITEATVRVVRPNPGWRDLEDKLGDEAGKSDAGRADITMNARRKASLNRKEGIVSWIRQAFGKGELGYAAIKGQRGKHVDKFNTEKLGKHEYLNLDVDDRGQIVAGDAWAKLSEMMDDMD